MIMIFYNLNIIFITYILYILNLLNEKYEILMTIDYEIDWSKIWILKKNRWFLLSLIITFVSKICNSCSANLRPGLEKWRKLCILWQILYNNLNGLEWSYRKKIPHSDLPMHMRAPWPQTRFEMAFTSCFIAVPFVQRSGLNFSGSGKYFSSWHIPYTCPWTWVCKMCRVCISDGMHA